MDVSGIGAALNTKLGFGVVHSGGDGKSLRLVGRIPSTNTDSYKVVAKNLLVASGTRGWTVDISKYYFVRPPNADGTLYFAYRFLFESDESLPVESIVSIIMGSVLPRQSSDLVVPLNASPNRNNPLSSNGKGASVGIVVPSIVRRGR